MTIRELQQWLYDNNFFEKGISLARAVDGKLGNVTKAALAKAQEYLKGLNLYTKKIDGLMGEGTEKAIQRWNQAKRQIKVKLADGTSKIIRYNAFDTRGIDNVLNQLKELGVSKININGNQVQPFHTDATQQLTKAMRSITSPEQQAPQEASSVPGMFSIALDYAKVFSTEDVTAPPRERAEEKRLKAEKALERQPKNYVEIASQNDEPPRWSYAPKIEDYTTPPTQDTYSSFDPNSLDDLLIRYTYDKYHGHQVNDLIWGIKYDYQPTGRKMANRNAPVLEIMSKWTPEQAEQIARGAGMATYRYKGQTHSVNLFKGGQYADLDAFNKAIADLESQGNLEVAQKLYNDEIARQYNTHGIDFLMLKDKTGWQWNDLYGIVPYGYNPESAAAIIRGEQALLPLEYKKDKNGNFELDENGNPIIIRPEVSATRTSQPQYRYDPETGEGRLDYSDYAGWREGRLLANPAYQKQKGISAVRAVTSIYHMGFPVASSMREVLRPSGARPNATSIDRNNYYDIVDSSKGSAQMQPWVYSEVARNPQAAYRYFQYIMGDPKGTGKTRQILDFNNPQSAMSLEADRLAKEAGLSSWHKADANNPWYNATGHDIYSSMKSFYENAFDANHNLKPTFKYAENGYNRGFDGGGYTTFIKDGKPSYSLDYWNTDLPGLPKWLDNTKVDPGTYLNAGLNNQGMPVIVRHSKYGGKFIQLCQKGGGLVGGNKEGDNVSSEQCATWMNNLLRKNGYAIYGDAWSSDVTPVFNGYEGLEKPATYDKDAVESYNKKASWNVLTGLRHKTLDKSKPYVVNMYYKGSPYQEQAYNKGKGRTGTHTGILTYEDGSWKVTHNIHGKIYQHNFLGLQGGFRSLGVTGVYEPKLQNPSKAKTTPAPEEPKKKGLRGLFGFKYGGVL